MEYYENYPNSVVCSNLFSVPAGLVVSLMVLTPLGTWAWAASPR